MSLNSLASKMRSFDEEDILKMFETHAMNLQLQDQLSKPQSLSTIPAIENVAEVTNKFQVEPATREPLQTKPTSQNKTSLPPFDPPSIYAPNFVAPQMEERITLNSPQNFSLEGEQIAEVNFAAIQRAENKVESRIRCEVCLDKENYSDDDIVLCEMCLCAVHQSCYSRELRGGVPEDDWFCERCRFLRTEGKISENKLKEVKCEFCSDVKGCIIHKKPFGWCHISCVNLIQGLYFKEDKKKTKVIGKIHKGSYRVKCEFCNKKEGVCIKCDFEGCTTRFHVSCATKNNIITEWYEMDEFKDSDDGNLKYVYCSNHRTIVKRERKKNSSRQFLMDCEKKIKEEKHSI